MRTTALLALAIALFCACGLLESSPPSSALESKAAPLIGGALDDDDPGVVGLSRGGTTSFCTGTLISPSVILTAAHCIDMAGSDPNIIAFFGPDLAGDGTRIGIGRKEKHINWTGSVGSNDIGMLLLNFPQDPFMAVPLNTVPLTDFTNAQDAYRHVGFGVFEINGTSQIADGKKRQGTTTITSAESDVVRHADPNVAVCFGDSGGPGLVTVNDVEYVAGIHSFTTGQNCDPDFGDTRVDLYVEDFIIPWVQDNDPVCGKDNLCAPVGCIDDPDCEPCGADGTCTDSCALPDPDCPTSAIGEICQADSQCDTDLCVFWSGDNTYHFCSEPCQLGGSGCPGGMSCQTIQPFGDICYYDDDPVGVIGDSCSAATDCGAYLCEDSQCVKPCDLSVGQICPSGFECEARDSEDFFCFALDSGGGSCSVGAAGGSPGGWLGVVLALALGARRRARRPRRSRRPVN